MSTELLEKLVERTPKTSPNWPRPILGLVAAALALAALTGCGGPAEEGQAAGGDGSGGEI